MVRKDSNNTNGLRYCFSYTSKDKTFLLYSLALIKDWLIGLTREIQELCFMKRIVCLYNCNCFKVYNIFKYQNHSTLLKLPAYRILECLCSTRIVQVHWLAVDGNLITSMFACFFLPFTNLLNNLFHCSNHCRYMMEWGLQLRKRQWQMYIEKAAGCFHGLFLHEWEAKNCTSTHWII